MKKLNFAIIGCGRISKKHVEGIANNYKEANLVAVCDIMPDKMECTIDKYIEVLNNKNMDIYKSSIKKYTDYNEMIKKEDIDVVTIATESGYHAKHVIDCLDLGVHIIVEKPIALSIQDADNMINKAREKGLKLAVCHQNRFNKPIQMLRQAVENNRFGKVVNGTARILWNRNMNYYEQAPWRGTWEFDGGTLMNQCIHNIDLLQWMMGGEIESVYAQIGRFLRDIEAEDFGAIIIRFKSGAIGIIEGSACVYPKNLEETLSIFGEKGTSVIGGLAVNKIQTWRFEDDLDSEEGIIKNQEDDPDSVYGFGHTPLFKDFIDSIKEDRQPLINGEEGKKAVNIILAAYKSSKEKNVIDFPVKNISTMDFKEK